MISPLLNACLLLAITALGAHSQQYGDLEMLGLNATCPSLDSCRLIRPRADFTDRNCECDDLCAHYGDCCIDAPAARRPVSRTRETCMPHGMPEAHQGAFVVDWCPAGADRRLAANCTRDDFSDPILSAPVTDARARRTYLNRYCAQCHDAPPRLQMWHPIVFCPNEEENNYRWADVTRGRHGWTVNGDACKLLFGRPVDLSGGPRRCRSGLVSTCPVSWRRRESIRLCDAYLAAFTGPEKVVYRNPHCALCNGLTVDAIACYKREPESSLGARKRFSFALLLDVNRAEGDLVGVSAECPRGQKYDPFHKKCRSLSCGIPGYVVKNGKCVAP